MAVISHSTTNAVHLILQKSDYQSSDRDERIELHFHLNTASAASACDMQAHESSFHHRMRHKHHEQEKKLFDENFHTVCNSIAATLGEVLLQVTIYRDAHQHTLILLLHARKTTSRLEKRSG